MRRLLAFIGGALTGGAVGTAVALLFTPRSGMSMRRGMRAHFQEAMTAGQIAAAQKRAELEAELVAMTGPHPAGSPMVLRKPGDGRL
jgi:gas vesicle protein